MSKSTDSFEEYSFEWPIFPKDETERELRISEVAMREGADGFPSSDSTIMSMTENEIVGRVRRFYVSVLEKISDEFVRLGEETANIKIFLENFNLKQMPIQLKGKVESDLTDASVRMQPLALQSKSAYEDLLDFKKENGITRDPIYSMQWRRIWGPLLVLFLFGSEIVLNGALVSGVVDGLIAGIAVATTVSTINVVLSFVVGKNLLPELNRAKITVSKWLSMLGIGIYVLTILYTNFVFGIFRSSVLSTANIRSWEDVADSQIIINAIKPWESLSQISDVPSLFVIGVGIVFAIIALLDGYKYDDPYPNYGDVHRKFVDAVTPFEQEKKELSDRILGTVEDKCSQMEGRIGEYQARLTRWSTMQNIALQQMARYVAWMDQIEQDANKFLNDYRSANIRGRHSNYSTQGAPAYFALRWSFTEEEKDPSKKFSHLTSLIADDRKEYEDKNLKVQQEMVSVRDECVHSLGSFLNRLQEELDKK